MAIAPKGSIAIWDMAIECKLTNATPPVAVRKSRLLNMRAAVLASKAWMTPAFCHNAVRLLWHGILFTFTGGERLRHVP